MAKIKDTGEIVRVDRLEWIDGKLEWIFSGPKMVKPSQVQLKIEVEEPRLKNILRKIEL